MMKSLLHVLLPLFLLAFTTTSTLAQKVVLDSNGYPLINGRTSYYIKPVSGGGLEVAQTGNETCPLTVVQALNDVYKGFPAIITCDYPIIATSFLVNIEFARSKQAATCLPSPAPWKFEQESQAVKISTEGTPWNEPFRIQNVSDTDYKIQYCDKDDNSNLKCKDLGISIDNDNKRRLVVNNESPLVVRFDLASIAAT